MANMSKARDIFDKAKADLISHIKYETEQISLIVSGGGDNSHTEEEDWMYNPSVMVYVDNSYLDVEDTITESRKVVEIEVGNGRVQIITEEGDDIDAKYLSVEELYAIADCLEKSYFSLVKNN